MAAAVRFSTGFSLYYVIRVAACAAATVGLCDPQAVRAATPPRAAALEAVARTAMAAQHGRAVIVEVRENGVDLYKGALGTSMAGVPASADMRFRNGALAFTYMSTLLLEMVDQHKTTLDTKLSAYFPELPSANAVSLRNLSQMTSGYADYVYQQAFIDALYRDPFQQWKPEELIHIGASKPIQFAPGTNFGYSHTNYVILGRVLEKITDMSLPAALQKYVLGPMGLRHTVQSATPAIPSPALHSFTSERRETLGIKDDIPFSEEATFWNPSWTTIDGAVETTDISDLCTSLEAVGTGKLLSAASHKAQVSASLAGFGHKQDNCPACQPLNRGFNYGLGVINTNDWVVQTLGFAGASGAVAYLPARKLSVAVELTNLPSAYDPKSGALLGATGVWRALIEAVAPGTLPPVDKQNHGI
jgi:CubicO group peptidase (beta-lactamase class C family)